ncbi:hypothetical protein E2542_SST28914 [Spatholobus suberectus]|nr:hypothetical protein E2542_SST28914 [Spatholobus suberectus]
MLTKLAEFMRVHIPASHECCKPKRLDEVDHSPMTRREARIRQANFQSVRQIEVRSYWLQIDLRYYLSGAMHKK